MRRTIAAAVLAASLACAGPASAAVGIELFGAWNGHAMRAMNDSLESLNAGIGSAFPPIHTGIGGGAALRVWARPDLLVRLGAERLVAGTRDGDTRLDLDAWAFSGGVTWFASRSGAVRGGLGAAVEHYLGSGRIASLDVAGDGWGARGAAEVAKPLGHGWSVTATLGYRIGGIAGLQVGTAHTALHAEYTGPVLRIGVAADGNDVRP